MSTEVKEFGKWRSRLWPVHNFELKKFIPMIGLLFLILFNYTILRDTKDSLIVPASGAETITFIKFWGVLPCAALFMLIFAKLSNVLSKAKLFCYTIGFFVAFFALFAFVLYPLRETLHPTESAERLAAMLPAGFRGLIAIYKNWTYSLFYIMSELWGSAALSLLFWGFANDITRVSESKRFYSLFGAFANVALLVSGPLIIFFSKIRDKVPHDVDAWQVSLNYLMGMVIISGLLTIGIYMWMQKNVLTDPRFYDTKERERAKKEKPKLSIKESFMYLVSSKYIGCIAVLVLCYGITINLIEVTWKSQLAKQFTNHNDYSAFMGLFSTLTGFVTIFTTFFVGGNFLRRFGWSKTALATPIILGITGGMFLAFIIFKESLSGVTAALGTTTLMMAVITGMIQNIAAKSTKYAMFDPTKELAYIPLDQEAKVKGKAAVDVVGARLGKSGGALIQQGLILSFGSIALITPYVAAILAAFVLIWIVAARSLAKQFTALTEKKEEKATTSPSTQAAPASA
ncbi:MAG: NTP/NDP exchange transporter [Simkaniaceae bacterium]|nr:NTP/NDP exchange transporter [Simkaniaceae bacterium]